MPKIIIRGFLSFILFFPLLYAVLVYLNNYEGEPVADEELQQSIAQAEHWLTEHSESLAQHHNPGLWEFLAEASEKLESQALKRIVNGYRSRFRYSYREHPLRFQVYGAGAGVDNYMVDDLHDYPYYNHLMMYAFSCDASLAEYQSVREQLEVNFCQQHYRFSPACKTHQLLGFLYFRDSQCMAPSVYEPVITSLAADLKKQMFFDPRVVDVYVQRLLVLYKSGMAEDVRASWLRRVISAQGQDGGWDNFMPVIPVGGERAIGFGPRGVSLSGERSDFHATVQALLLLAYEQQARR